jgi:hypothetical protein
MDWIEQLLGIAPDNGPGEFRDLNAVEQPCRTYSGI